MAKLKGTAGDDNLVGTAGDDQVDLSLGGNDALVAGDGADRIVMGAGLTALDRIDGGAGRDTLVLNGEYGGLVLAAATIANIETLKLLGAADYALTSDDATVAAGATLSVDAHAASGSVAFDGSAETDGDFRFRDGSGSNLFAGGSGNDTFDLTRGAHDGVDGGDGNDRFTFGFNLTASDTIDGGAGSDTLTIANVVGPIAFGATTLTNVERLVLTGALSALLITSHDATVAGNATLSVDASTAGALSFDGSAESDGHFALIGSGGGDVLTGGALSDSFDMRQGGDDRTGGGAGDDMLAFHDAFSAADRVDGGTGRDTLTLDGDYSGGVLLAADTIVSIEIIKLKAGSDYTLTLDDSNVAAGETLTLDASGLGTGDDASLSGSNETDGSLILRGGAGDDTLVAGSGDDKLSGGEGIDDLTGGLGADRLNGGGSIDRFHYTAAAESTGTAHDTLVAFDAADDFLDLDVAVAQYNNTHDAGSAISRATFDADLALASAGYNTAHGALVINATGGDLAGHRFLIVDVNGDTLYAGGVDYVFDITGYFGALTIGHFI